MREIKFRAFLDNEMCEVIGIFTNTKEAVCVVTNRILLDEEREQYHIEQTPIEIPFNNIKLMQYTGLKDCNNKEIYEGDIVKFDDGEIAEVIFFCGAFMTKLKKGQCVRIEYDAKPIWQDGEVIGNIHENPELLGGHK